MKHTINIIVSYLLKPFGELLPLFLTLIILTSISAITPYLQIDIFYSSQLIVSSALISYGVIFIIGCLPRQLGKVALGIFFCIYLLTAAMSLASYYFYRTGFSGDLAAVIAGTTIPESIEFLDYLSINQIIILSVGIIFALCSPFLILKLLCVIIDRLRPLFITLSGISVAVGIFVTFWNPAIHSNTLLGHVEKCGYLFENVPDLRSFSSNPQLTALTRLPDNIVIIIGESFSKKHSSLYNYPLPTNPRLTAMRDSGDLFVFNNAIAPYVQTIECFKLIVR